MTTHLKLESAGVASVSLGDACRAPQRLFAQTQSAADARTAAADALANPVGFPALAQAVVPGDQIALALGEGLPDLTRLAAGLLDGLQGAGVEPSHVALVTTAEADHALLADALGGMLPADVTIVQHDPTDEQKLCFAGVTREDDQSLLINRTLFDADMAIPVSCVRGAQDRDHRGAYSGLYPAFADAACRKQFLKTADQRHTWWAERTEEAGWLIGAPLVVQVAPGPDDTVAEVVAGAPGEAAAEGAAAASRQWRCVADTQASLVIAVIGGPPERQTWDDLARALAAAERACAPGGAVALCSGLNARVGRSLAKLRDTGDAEAAIAKLAGDSYPDTWAAQRLAAALARGPVFLLSRLSDTVVEDLGMGAIGGAEELERLASRFDSVVLLQDAQRLELTTDTPA